MYMRYTLDRDLGDALVGPQVRQGLKPLSHSESPRYED